MVRPWESVADPANAPHMDLNIAVQWFDVNVSAQVLMFCCKSMYEQRTYE